MTKRPTLDDLIGDNPRAADTRFVDLVAMMRADMPLTADADIVRFAERYFERLGDVEKFERELSAIKTERKRVSAILHYATKQSEWDHGWFLAFSTDFTVEEAAQSILKATYGKKDKPAFKVVGGKDAA